MSSITANEGCCSICGDLYDDIILDLWSQSDAFGTESLTDQQQAFLEQISGNKVPESCPECMD